MNKNLIHIGPVNPVYNRYFTRILKYTIEIYHEGLGERLVLSGHDENALEEKVKFQSSKWVSLYEKADGIERAKTKTNEANEINNRLKSLLVDIVDSNPIFDFSKLKKKEPFGLEKPPQPDRLAQLPVPEKPDKDRPEFIPTLTFLEKVIPPLKKSKKKIYEAKYADAIAEWQIVKQEMNNKNELNNKEFNAKISSWNDAVQEWSDKKAFFVKEQNDHNESIDLFFKRYSGGEVNAIVEYCEIILARSDYPEFIAKRFDLEYN